MGGGRFRFVSLHGWATIPSGRYSCKPDDTDGTRRWRFCYRHRLVSVTVLGPRLLRDDGEVQFLGVSEDRQQGSGSQLGLGQQPM